MSTGNQPPNTGNQPANVANQPVIAVNQPANILNQPANAANQPVNPGNQTTNESKYADTEEFAIWAKYEDVAMHFNELIIRLRTQALGGLTAIVAISGLAVNFAQKPVTQPQWEILFGTVLQRNCAPAEIMEMIPVLTLEEIQVIQQYVRDNHDAVMEQDRRIREREANRVTPPEILKIREEGRARRLALMEQFAKKKAQQDLS